MAKLTIADAARVTGVSRMLLYRYIKAGKLSRTPEGLIDTAELLRAGLLLQTSDVTIPVTTLHDVTSAAVTPETPVTNPVTETVTPAVSTETRTLERLIDVLQRELEAARERETLLLQMLQQLQHQNQRLLDLPRSAPAPTTRETPQDAPGATQAPRRPHRQPAPPTPLQEPPGDPRGAMRRRIVALLQDYPEGLTPAEMRDLLGVDKSLADTCLGMLRYGLVQRVGHGRYATAISAQPHQP
jgi:hypothetical protein